MDSFNKEAIKKRLTEAFDLAGLVKDESCIARIVEAVEQDTLNFSENLTDHHLNEKFIEKIKEHHSLLLAQVFKSIQAYKRFQEKENTSDIHLQELLTLKNSDLMDENSNKNAQIVATQRDLMAGEISKDLSKRKLLPLDLLMAHEQGILHIHDLDYFLQPMFNCCLIHLEDMLQQGTVINGKKIETPHSFQVACTVMTQIIAQVASSQYGGQSINGVDRILAPYARKSFLRYKEMAKKEQEEIYGMAYREDLAEKIALSRLKKEIKDGVQTIQYQINTLMTTNGQSPFVTLFLHFEKDDPYAQEASWICEEIFKQRIQGIKNAQGVWITPAFPKLIYVLDEHNVHEHSPYFYLTQLAAECTSKRMYPDYISAKKMKALYEGEIFSPMGCRSFLSPYKNEKGNWQWDGRFNQGVVTLNLPQIALLTNTEKEFFELLDKRLRLVKKALMLRHEYLKNVTSDVSPIHWQHGALLRLKPGEKIEPYLKNGYSTLSIGYIGIYEACQKICNCSHTTEKGKAFALKIMEKLNEAKTLWSNEEKIAFAVYGTPAESLTHRFCQVDQKLFGQVAQVTDKGYYTNSYHVDVREPINIFEKFSFESDFQEKSTGGMISYAEIPNMQHNLLALIKMLQYVYEHIMYGEFNTKLDFCHQCHYDGEMFVNDEGVWECPNCKNQNRKYLTVIRRTCGYLGENFWNKGRTQEIKSRVLHI